MMMMSAGCDPARNHSHCYCCGMRDGDAVHATMMVMVGVAGDDDERMGDT